MKTESAILTCTLGELKELKTGNTIYQLEKGNGNWFMFTRVIHNPKPKAMEANYSIKEDFSINLKTREVYCNRTGRRSYGLKTFLKMVIRIENIFKLSSLLDN